MKHLRLFPLLVVLGCDVAERDPAGLTSLTIYVPPNNFVTPAEALAACKAWEVVGVDCRLVETEDEANTWVQLVESSDACYAWGGTDGVIVVNALNWVSWLGNTDKPVVVLAHEFGHRLGVDHLPGPEGLMANWPTIPKPVATDHDIAAYWRSR